MMALVGVATVEFVVRFFGSRSNGRAILKLAALVGFIGFSIFGVALWRAFGSDYMSGELIAQAERGQKFGVSLKQGSELCWMLAWFVVPSLGCRGICPG